MAQNSCVMKFSVKPPHEVAYSLDLSVLEEEATSWSGLTENFIKQEFCVVPHIYNKISFSVPFL